MGIRVDIGKNAYRSGDDLVFEFTVDDADAESPQPKDLTGATIVWVLAAEQGSAPIVVKTAQPSEINVTDAGNGVVEVLVQQGDTDSLSGAHWHELEITDASGKRHTSAYGIFYIEPDSANQ